MRSSKRLAHAAEDADITLQLHHRLWPEIEKDEMLTRGIERHRNAFATSVE